VLVETVRNTTGTVLALALLESCMDGDVAGRAYPTYRTPGPPSSPDTLSSFLRKLLLLGRSGSLSTPRPSSC
jgi:hypothetical protein